jgi:D-alanyl-lipoteichoic acid acyltransferase DltB (MBOAT superfamily)
MTLASLSFAILVLATAVLLKVVPPARRAALLVVASAVFYVSSSPLGAIWLAAAVALAYLAARRLDRMAPGRARIVVATSVTLLLGAMALLRAAPHLATRPGALGLLSAVGVPVGISYVTFRLVSYVLDVGWGRCEPARDVTAFIAYAAFFPHLTSGPIQRWGEFEEGARLSPPTYEALSAGMRLVLLGLVKKFVVANRLGLLVDPAFAAPQRLSSWVALAAIYAFPLQLYFDFSGLTDVARGVSALLGIPAPPNFDRPFLARSVQEFWTRWHMSLTRWLRDYLFTPVHLALRSSGVFGLMAAITVNMLAVGLWHGLTWTFAVFGVLNAAYVAVPAWRRARSSKRPKPSSSPWAVASDVLVTFHLMALAFVFFRAETIGGAASLLAAAARATRAAGPALQGLPIGWELFWTSALGALILAMEWGGAQGARRWWREARYSPALRWAVYYAAVLLLFFVGEWGTRTFIYARF